MQAAEAAHMVMKEASDQEGNIHEEEETEICKIVGHILLYIFFLFMFAWYVDL